MRLLRIHLLLLTALLLPASLFAQTRTVWSSASDIKASLRGSIVGTVTDIDASRGQLTMVADADPEDRSIQVTTDSLVTQYRGFGATATDVMAGSGGFNQIRVGDRLDVRGMGGASSSIAAEEILLVGHETSTSARALPTSGRVEGVVRSVATEQNRIVIEGTDRVLYTVTGTAATPVNYRGEIYRISNIEIGDRIRVDIDATISRNEVRARSIDVLESTPQAGSAASGDQRTLTMISGRVTRIDTRTQTIRIRAERGTEYLVDARSAVDRTGRPLKLLSLRVGDTVEVSGQFGPSDVFRASSIRPAGSGGRDETEDVGTYPDDRSTSGGELVLSVITGTLRADLRENNVLTVEDPNSGRSYDVWASDDLPVRTRTGAYITAEQLRTGDRLTVKAVLDCDRRYIAQTIRMR